ncbi:MAG: trypsin-like serine protease [Hyphomicrobiaceae bacterium]|nr:trypsin-like serine protease [Hyphomicrobiaceae bacterium]
MPRYSMVTGTALAALLIGGLLGGAAPACSQEDARTFRSLSTPDSAAAYRQAAFVSRLEACARARAGAGTALYWAIVRVNLATARADDLTPAPAGEPCDGFVTDVVPTDFDASPEARRAFESTLEGIRSGKRVYGGSEVPAGQFRNVVAFADDKGAFCTGTYIGGRAIVTAAHCVCELRTLAGGYTPERADAVVFGRQVPNEEEARFPISRFRLFRPDFCRREADPDNLRDRDIALVFFADGAGGAAERLLTAPAASARDPAVFADESTGGVTPARLAAPSLLFARALGEMVVVGFGRTERGPTGRKLHASVPVADRLCLKDGLGNSGCAPGREIVLADMQGKRDTCRGDSGGPVFVFDGDSYFLAAVTSRAAATSGGDQFLCGPGGIYALLTPDVARWIARETGLALAVCEGDQHCARP